MFEKFLDNQNTWLSGEGPSSEIVFSSRVRLARNFSEYPFPFRASMVEKKNIVKKVKETCARSEIIKGSMFVDMQDLSDLDKQFLLERHLISQEHAFSATENGLVVSKDEKISLMINEEDHLRMQVIMPGFNLDACWENINEIDDYLSKEIPFAFMPDLGYLATCPTNVGTGLRASCMLHLPALVLTKRINKVLELLAKISFATRGLFGEGTASYGNFFQISNQVSLGLTEKELIDNLVGVVNQVKAQETEARNILLKRYQLTLQDTVWRALGVLRSACLINSKEALQYLSMLSLGLDLGIIKGEGLFKEKANDEGPVVSLSGREALEEEPSARNIKKIVNSLFIIIQPAHLQKIEGKPLKEKERDYIRATILKKRLGGINV